MRCTTPTHHQGSPQAFTFDLGIVGLGFAHEQCRRLAIERVCWVGIQQQLRQERLEDVQQVCASQTSPLAGGVMLLQMPAWHAQHGQARGSERPGLDTDSQS